jgi:NAD(P)-dependent dehydrogenase (short-subunit alcohol dehydrogenase family)
VIILCRSPEKAAAASNEITQQSGNPVEVEELNLASLQSVRECAERLLGKLSQIDLLVNNAGVGMCPQQKTEDGFDLLFGTNHLGHFLLTELLMPLLKKSSELGNKPR